MTSLFRRPGLATEEGQILVIVGGGMLALVAMAGLVIDVGFAWARNRETQNGIDAAAHAGAIVIVEELAGADPAKTDADVATAVAGLAAENGVTLESAVYTDWQGTPLDIDVGSAPGNAIPPSAQGVFAEGSMVASTFLAQVVGITELTTRAAATAVGGPGDPCAGEQPCALLPITFPTTVVTCDGQNKSVPSEGGDGMPYEWVSNTHYVIPLCGNNPGSVGWLDWYPPAGGASELADEICDPNPPELNLPDWFEVTSTGNVNSANVEDCINQYAGDHILLPMFDDTCRVDPGEGNPCTNPAATGQNQWYHFPSFAVFELDEPKGAYVNGNNSAACDPGGGNGATSCLIGRFVDAVGSGEVGEWVPDNSAPSQLWAVQLIK